MCIWCGAIVIASTLGCMGRYADVSRRFAQVWGAVNRQRKNPNGATRTMRYTVGVSFRCYAKVSLFLAARRFASFV